MFVGKSVIARQAGFTFNELLVAMNIVVVVVLGYSLSSIDVSRRQTIAGNSTAAINLAQDKIEALQAQKLPPDVDLCPTGGDRAISATGSAPGRFDRCWRVSPSPFGANLKQIEVQVIWRDHAAHQLSFSTLLFTGE